ncbi:helicase SNF2 [Acidaminobacter sp. JC074]|uniref:DEAD/DEAH box helicase n=1 Tax=Acidaminobacter sp. JC074 TaxID=2530199 RepID=UPI001F114002|nr:SNF2 helicase associated domain-containing protein [Acidaminobacter sp. JC074]MCH4886941.1 helicase SNF2 [Acidaminobacter sp. JC074]
MLNYEIQDIIRASTSLAVFKRGNEYYKGNRVTRLTYAPDLERIYAKVEGSVPYHVDVRLDDGLIDDAFCDCRAFHEYPGFCKHIVATLLHAKFNQNIAPETLALCQVLDYYMDTDFEKAQGHLELNVDYTLTISNYQATVNVKVGQDMDYIIKEPLHFFDNLDHNYIFGKKFEYDPFVHRFSQEDLDLFEFLKSVLISYNSFNERKQQYKNIDTKDIYLSAYHLKKFLKLINKPIHLKMRDASSQVHVVYEDIKPELVLEEKENIFQLNLMDLKAYHSLTEDYGVLRKDDKMHMISDNQRKELFPLFQMINHQYDFLDVKKDEIDHFMSYMFPVIERSSDVIIDGNLEEKLLRYPCQSRLYLDQKDFVIYAEIKHVYGDYTIDALEDFESLEDQFLLRDLKHENRIMHIMESSAFKVSKKGYYMSDVDDIYSFLSDRLPALQQSMDVYYSDAFKHLEVKDKEAVQVFSGLETSGDFFSFKFSVDGLDQREIASLIDDIILKKKYYRLKDGSFLSLDDVYFEKISDMLIDLDLKGKDLELGEKRLPTYLAFYFNEALGQTAIMDDKLKSLIEAPAVENYNLPEGVNATLRPYQTSGFNWLKTLSKYGFGGILADDMGLGKTIQTLTYIQSEIKEGLASKVLIVAPTSLVYNWMNEIRKFVPDMKGLIIDGNKKQREDKLGLLDQYDLLITSYALVRNDLEIYKEMPLDICIIDEAQHIKNPNSKTAKALKSLDVKRKFALTGTPIENGLIELWSIFDFIMPQYLGGITKFKSKYELPIKNQEPTSLKSMVQPFIMRRLKGDVLKELPDKIENKMIVDLNDEQKKVYVAHLNRYKEELQAIYKRDGYQKSHMKTLAALTRLRQICLDPSLFLDNYDGGSSKLDLLSELLDELLAGGHRVLIFSQFTSMLSNVQELLNEKKVGYFYIDGKTKALERSVLVDKYNEGENDVFLISLKAGGTGLNLTGADTVIHCDPWWNPAVEDQATDRAHRIGQKKTVHVIKIVTKGTIEEKIYELQDKKKALINQVIQPGETFITGLSEEEIKALFS